MADNKPASVPSWATDANFSSGPETGNPTKVEPSTGAKAQGQVPGQPYRGQRVNWLWNLICQWLFYLSDLHNQTQFLNKAYTWTANHIFNGVLKLGAAIHLIDVNARLDWTGGTKSYTVPIPLCPNGFIGLGGGDAVDGGGTARFSVVEGAEQWEVRGQGSPGFNGVVLCFQVPAGLLQLNNDKITSFSFTCHPNADDITVDLMQVGTFGGIVATGTKAGGSSAGNTTVVIAPGDQEFVGLGYYYFRVTFGGSNAADATLSSINLSFSRLSAIV